MRASSSMGHKRRIQFAAAIFRPLSRWALPSVACAGMVMTAVDAWISEHGKHRVFAYESSMLPHWRSDWSKANGGIAFTRRSVAIVRWIARPGGCSIRGGKQRRGRHSSAQRFYGSAAIRRSRVHARRVGLRITRSHFPARGCFSTGPVTLPSVPQIAHRTRTVQPRFVPRMSARLSVGSPCLHGL